MIILYSLFGFFLSVLAQSSTQSFIIACHHEPIEFKRIIKSVNFLKVDEDKILINKNCIDIKTESSREKLYSKFLRAKHPSIKLTTNDSYSNPEKCHLDLIKIERNISDKTELGHSKNTILLFNQHSKKNKTSTSSIFVQDGKEVSLQIDNDYLNLKCSIKRNSYLISLWTHSKTFLVSNTFSISKGQIKEIGKFQQTTDGKNHNIQIVKNRIKINDIKKVITLKLKAN